ncbi:MAG: hypothetical protein JOS17DRAFT_468965 [Linnemannia elongata]|nr:MAG: hypothetical protein JOS17DRAFT_468965 [Linnemannia elongata]
MPTPSLTPLVDDAFLSSTSSPSLHSSATPSTSPLLKSPIRLATPTTASINPPLLHSLSHTPEIHNIVHNELQTFSFPPFRMTSPLAEAMLTPVVRLSIAELDELSKQQLDGQEKDYIIPPISPSAPRCCLLKRKHGSLHMCLDYTGPNCITKQRIDILSSASTS